MKITILLSAALSFCIHLTFAQSGSGQTQKKIQELQRIKIVKNPVPGEDKINAQLADLESKTEAIQAEIQKVQLDMENLKSVQNDLKGDLDAMNEMSEMTSMRLQMAMDRRSKFVETLSNVMKKIDDTQEAIVQNMK